MNKGKEETKKMVEDSFESVENVLSALMSAFPPVVERIRRQQLAHDICRGAISSYSHVDAVIVAGGLWMRVIYNLAKDLDILTPEMEGFGKQVLHDNVEVT